MLVKIHTSRPSKRCREHGDYAEVAGLHLARYLYPRASRGEASTHSLSCCLVLILCQTEPESIIRIHSERNAPSSHTLKQYRVEVKSRSLITAAKKGVMRVQHMAEWTPTESATIINSIITSTNPQPDSVESTSRVWVPASLVEIHLPALIHAFTTRGGKRRRPSTSTPKSTATASCDHQGMEIIEITDSDEDTANHQQASHGTKRKRHAFDAYALEVLDLTDSD